VFIRDRGADFERDEAVGIVPAFDFSAISSASSSSFPRSCGGGGGGGVIGEVAGEVLAFSRIFPSMILPVPPDRNGKIMWGKMMGERGGVGGE